jgi:hypothetical protein
MTNSSGTRARDIDDTASQALSRLLQLPVELKLMVLEEVSYRLRPFYQVHATASGGGSDTD